MKALSKTRMFTIYNQNLLKISNYGYTEFTRRILHNPGLDFVSIWCQRSCWWKGCKHKFFKEFVLLAALYLVSVGKVYSITGWATRSSFIIIILYRVILWFIVGSRDKRKKSVCLFRLYKLLSDSIICSCNARRVSAFSRDAGRNNKHISVSEFF